METGRMLSVMIVLLLALITLSGCAAKVPAANDDSNGLVAEQKGDIRVEVPAQSDESDKAPAASAPTEAAVKPATAEEKAAYLKIEAEYLCESMTLEPDQQQEFEQIAKKYGMTLDRMQEITNQLGKAKAMQEVGTEASKMCPEAFVPKIE